MKRKIALVTYQLEEPELQLLLGAADRYSYYMNSSGLEVACEVVGNLEELKGQVGQKRFPPLRADKTYESNALFMYVIQEVRFQKRLKKFFENYSDVLLVINNKVIDPYPTHWHIIQRGGQEYGAVGNRESTGSTGYLSLQPLPAIQEQNMKEVYLDFLLRHEGGHMFGLRRDLSENAADNIMKPIPYAQSEYLRTRNLDYSEAQINRMKKKIAMETVDVIRAFNYGNRP